MMGRVSVSDAGNSGSMSFKGKGPRMLGCPTSTSHEKTMKSMFGKTATKGLLRKPALETVSSKPGQSHVCANAKAGKDVDVAEVRRANSNIGNVRLCNSFEAGTPKEPERRKKVDKRSHLSKDKIVEGVRCTGGQETFANKSTPVRPKAKTSKGVVHDSAGLVTNNTGSQLKPESISAKTENDTYVREGCQKEDFQEKGSSFGSEDWAILGSCSQDEPHKGDAFAKRRILHSPSASDSSSSLSTLESSSFSYKSEASCFAKGEASPSNRNQPASTPLCRSFLRSTAVSLQKRRDPVLKSHHKSKEPLPLQSKTSGKQPVGEDFLEFKFLEGRMVERTDLRKNVNGKLLIEDRINAISSFSGSSRVDWTTQFDNAGEPSDNASMGINEHNFANMEFSDEEWASGLMTPAFFSATARSPESCSEISLHSDDVHSQIPFQSDSPTQDKTSKPVYFRQVVAEVYTHDWQAETHKMEPTVQFQAPISAGLAVSSEPSTLLETPSRIAQLNKDSMKPQSLANKLQIDVSRVFLHSGASPSQRFSAADADILRDNLKPGEGHFRHCSPMLAPQQNPHCTRSGFAVSEIDLFRESELRERPITGPTNPSGVQVDRLRPEKSQVQATAPISFKAPWSWRAKSVNARTTSSSAIQNLEAVFLGSRSNSPFQRVFPVAEGVPNMENSRPKQKLSISPFRSWRNSLLTPQASQSSKNNSSKHQEIPQTRTLQRVDRTRSQSSFRRNAMTDVSSEKCFHVDPDSAFYHAAGYPISMSMPSFNGKYTSPEMDISCKPFLPVSKTIQCLPAPKSALDTRKPFLSASPKSVNLFSVHSFMGDVIPSSMLHGYLQYAQQDGIPSYTLLLDNSEDMLIAQACQSVNHTAEQGYNWVYTFHSRRCKGKGEGKVGWRNWRGKDKPSLDIACKMKVSSVLRQEVTCSGEIKQLLESEFVLFDGRAENVTQSQSLRFMPSDISVHPSLPHVKLSSNSMKGSVPSISNAPAITVSRSSTPRHQLSPRVVPRNSFNVGSAMDSTGCLAKDLSPMKARLGHRPSFSQDVSSGSDLIVPEVKPFSWCPSHMELAAIVIRMPAEEEYSAKHPPTRKQAWGWGLNFLGKSSDTSMKHEATSRVEAVKGMGRMVEVAEKLDEVAADSPSRRLDGLNQWCGSMDYQALKVGSANQGNCTNSLESVERQIYKPSCTYNTETINEQVYAKLHGQANVTIILPSGNHGLPADESCNPSSLIERWRSGGKCDCGGWDLGCGLTILSTQSSNSYDIEENLEFADTNCIKSFSSNNDLKIFSKDETVLSLAFVQNGLFSLSFQGYVSPLCAFATAISVLHSKDPWLSASTRETRCDFHKIQPQTPLKQPGILSRGSSRSEADIASLFPKLYEELAAHCSSESCVSPLGRC